MTVWPSFSTMMTSTSLYSTRVWSSPVGVDQAVLEEVDVVAVGEVLARVGPAALLPGQGAGDGGLGQVEQAAQLQHFQEAGVEDGPLVLHAEGLDSGSSRTAMASRARVRPSSVR